MIYCSGCEEVSFGVASKAKESVPSVRKYYKASVKQKLEGKRSKSNPLKNWNFDENEQAKGKRQKIRDFESPARFLPHQELQGRERKNLKA